MVEGLDPSNQLSQNPPVEPPKSSRPLVADAKFLRQAPKLPTRIQVEPRRAATAVCAVAAVSSRVSPESKY